LTKILIISGVVLGILLLAGWMDREQPEELDDTEESRAKRYLAERDGEDD
jgi:hypothetical protein